MHPIYASANLVLVAACVYALIVLNPELYPYAFLMAAFCLVHGLMGLVRAFYEDLDECSRTFVLSASVLEVIPLPLASYEFYQKSSLKSAAIVHALALVPLFYDLLGKLVGEWDSATDAIKDLAILANIGSLAYLGFTSKNNIFYYGVAGLAFLVRFGAFLVNHLIPSTGEYVATLGNAGIVGLTAYALTNTAGSSGSSGSSGSKSSKSSKSSSSSSKNKKKK